MPSRGRQTIAALTVALSTALLAAPCAAQLVVVQPGYVKAPFVRVYSNPDGSSYVRAPFVGVYTPPHHRVLGPTPEELAEADWWMLRRVVRKAAAQLDAELHQFPTGDVWRRNFQTAEIPHLVADVEGTPTEEERQIVAQLAAIYETGLKTPDLRAVTRLDNYRVLHAALRELALPAEPRLRRQLTTSARFLHRSLDHLRNGESWQRYLALPETLFALQEAVGDAVLQPEPSDVAALAKVRDRFEMVRQTPEYRGVARLTAFKITQQQLNDYVALLGGAPPALEQPPQGNPAQQNPAQQNPALEGPANGKAEELQTPVEALPAPRRE
ncbi:MAG: hypothetical protein RIC55_36600 [Pirellulaceae bacterium]